MKFNDSRSFKVAIIADYFVNPNAYPGLPDPGWVYESIRDLGYGMIKMPPMGIPAQSVTDWVTSTVDQIQEYGNRGFHVVIVGMKGMAGGGIWLDQIRSELERRKLQSPPTALLSTDEVAEKRPILSGFLAT